MINNDEQHAPAVSWEDRGATDVASASVDAAPGSAEHVLTTTRAVRRRLAHTHGDDFARAKRPAVDAVRAWQSWNF